MSETKYTSAGVTEATLDRLHGHKEDRTESINTVIVRLLDHYEACDDA